MDQHACGDDGLIDPKDTRQHLIMALRTLDKIPLEPSLTGLFRM